VRYISQEIRTPLNTVKMGLEVLKQDIEDTRSKKHNDTSYLRTVKDIRDSCDAALEVVNDFLLFDKIVSNKLSLDICPLELIDLVKTVTKTFQIQVNYSRRLSIYGIHR
jgi:signal transduction histidine kinase